MIIKFIDKLGNLGIQFFSIFRTVNRKQDVDLLLYKRGLCIIQFNDRIFIRNDKSGEEFIQKCLVGYCNEYKIEKRPLLKSIIANKNKPGNIHIASVWYNDLFRFEFISEEYWKHLEYSCELAEKYELTIGLDSIFVNSIEKIERLK